MTEFYFVLETKEAEMKKESIKYSHDSLITGKHGQNASYNAGSVKLRLVYS